MTVKIQDGATFTVFKRAHPATGQRAYYWLGDNGQQLELSDDEAAEHLKVIPRPSP